MTYLDQFPPGKRSLSFVEGMELKFLRELFFFAKLYLEEKGWWSESGFGGCGGN